MTTVVIGIQEYNGGVMIRKFPTVDRALRWRAEHPTFRTLYDVSGWIRAGLWLELATFLNRHKDAQVTKDAKIALFVKRRAQLITPPTLTPVLGEILCTTALNSKKTAVSTSDASKVKPKPRNG